MIKLEELTPKVYYKKSRDFQFIGRLYDLVLNSVKTNAEIINSLPVNDTLIDLMTLTLGFKSKRNYNIKQLTALCSVFMEIIRLKGTEEAIRLAGDTLISAEGITEPFDVIKDPDREVVRLLIPQQFTDTSLLYDLLPYILPAGIGIESVIGKIVDQNYTSSAVTYDSVDITTDMLAKEASIVINENTYGKADVYSTSHHGFISNSTVLNETDMEATIQTTPTNIEGESE